MTTKQQWLEVKHGNLHRKVSATFSFWQREIVRPERIRSSIILNLPDMYYFDAGENGVRIKAFEFIALSDSILDFIIKKDQFIGIATVDEDQLSVSNSSSVSKLRTLPIAEGPRCITTRIYTLPLIVECKRSDHGQSI